MTYPDFANSSANYAATTSDAEGGVGSGRRAIARGTESRKDAQCSILWAKYKIVWVVKTKMVEDIRDGIRVDGK